MISTNQCNFDVIVIGAGGVGSAALLHLAERGRRVMGIDSHFPPHDRGSSHGQTRIIRQAYFEHPDYVPLVLRAYDLWEEWSRRWGKPLFHRTGLVEVGRPDGVVLPGVREASRRHGIPIEEMTPTEAMRRFAGLVIPGGFDVVYEPTAGYLEVENCVQAMLDLAQRAGANVVGGDPVVHWGPDQGGYRVQTAQSTYRASKLVIAAGPWAARLIPDFANRLRVVRKTMHWFATQPGAYRASEGFPAFLAETSDGIFYGFPVIDDLGLKAAEHSGGQIVINPCQLDRDQKPEDSRRVADFLRRWLPHVLPTTLGFAPCMYTMTPDLHFLVGPLPGHDGVFLAAGLSGHGFKFAPVLGEILADLAIDGQTTRTIDFLSPSRSSPGWNGP